MTRGIVTKITKISTPRKLPAIRYIENPCIEQTRKLASLAIMYNFIYKHRASEVLLYIGGRGLVSQIIEPVTFARCAFIIALRNIALDGYLDTRRNI